MTEKNQIQHRKIRSFARRESRMSLLQRRSLEDSWGEYGIDFEQKTLDFQEIFGNNNPVVFEIGFGMGEAFFEVVAANPGFNFIGVEVHRPGVGAFLSNCLEAEIKNARVMVADAVEVLEEMVADSSLDKIQIFFPDPWPKRKHHKRRLVQNAFVALLAKKLKPGGILHLATDWQDYAEHMKDVMATCSAFARTEESALVARAKTKYEQRGERLGHGISDLIYKLK
ncbi:MAG: tRNA (guanosine(46)-N7)-methyltransferase TrmB [Gammaproteobacteria bacterium]